MNTLNVLVIIAAVLCTCLAQAKFVTKSSQRGFSLLGGLACLVVAAEAMGRGEFGSALLFGCATGVNILIAVYAYLKPANDA